MRSFNDMYNEVYKECCTPLETLRKTFKKRIILIVIIVFVSQIIINLLVPNITFSFFFLFLGLIVVMLYIGMAKPGKEYRKFFKENVIKKFVKEYSESLDFNPDAGMSKGIYNDAEFERYDNYSSEDLIYGTLEDGYKIQMAEVHTEEESTDSDGNTTTSTVFHGLFACVEFDKYINTYLKIRQNQKFLFIKNKHKLEMDSGEFEKIYDVYTENNIITMQLLTADIMQMFIDFKNKNKLIPQLTLKENKLYIRFETGGVFEASILKKSLDYEVLKRYYDIINFTLELTEKFIKNVNETEL